MGRSDCRPRPNCRGEQLVTRLKAVSNALSDHSRALLRSLRRDTRVFKLVGSQQRAADSGVGSEL